MKDKKIKYSWSWNMKYHYFHSAHWIKNCCSWEMSVIVFLSSELFYISLCSSQYWHACRFCFCSISDGEKLWWHHYRNYRRSSYKPFNPPLSARCLEQITIRPGQLCDGQAGELSCSLDIESTTVGSVWVSVVPVLSIVESLCSKLLLIGQEDPSEQ